MRIRGEPEPSRRFMDTYRRALIVSGLAAAACPPVASQPAAFTVQDLLGLSATLLQRPPGQLDAAVAARILQHLQARGLGPQLARLQADPRSEPALASELLSTWYTGICQTAAGPQVVTFTDALVWTTAAFLHPGSLCGGATQYWAAPPAA